MSIKLKGCKWPVDDELAKAYGNDEELLQRNLDYCRNYGPYGEISMPTNVVTLGDIQALRIVMAPFPCVTGRETFLWMFGYPQIKVFTDHSPEEMREHGWQLAGKRKHGQWAWIKQFPFQWGLWEMGIV